MRDHPSFRWRWLDPHSFRTTCKWTRHQSPPLVSEGGKHGASRPQKPLRLIRDGLLQTPLSSLYRVTIDQASSFLIRLNPLGEILNPFHVPVARPSTGLVHSTARTLKHASVSFVKPLCWKTNAILLHLHRVEYLLNFKCCLRIWEQQDRV